MQTRYITYLVLKSLWQRQYPVQNLAEFLTDHGKHLQIHLPLIKKIKYF